MTNPLMKGGERSSVRAELASSFVAKAYQRYSNMKKLPERHLYEQLAVQLMDGKVPLDFVQRETAVKKCANSIENVTSRQLKLMEQADDRKISAKYAGILFGIIAAVSLFFVDSGFALIVGALAAVEGVFGKFCAKKFKKHEMVAIEDIAKIGRPE